MLLLSELSSTILFLIKLDDLNEKEIKTFFQPEKCYR
jgi:hypothetical protein